MKGLKTKANWYISSKYFFISFNDLDIFISCYNDFDSPPKINETIGRQNDYETHSFSMVAAGDLRGLVSS